MDKERKPSQRKNHRGLTERQEAFCLNYVYYTGLDALLALELAGYNYTNSLNKDKAIRQLFRNVHVKKRINELVEERNHEIIVDKLWVIKELKKLATNANSEGAKNKALELLGKTMNMFSETHIYENKEDPGEVLRAARKKRMDALDEEAAKKIVEFPDKEGTNDEAD